MGIQLQLMPKQRTGAEKPRSDTRRNFALRKAEQGQSDCLLTINWYSVIYKSYLIDLQ